MSSHKGHKTPEEGARTPVLLATSPQVTASGEFWKDERAIDWDMSK
jgi:carbonyl reductase 1